MTRPSRLSTRAFWGLASWILPLGVVFVVSPRLLHLLGSERFGVLMIALVTPIVASQMEFGITSAAVRRLASRLRVGQIDASTTLFTLFVSLLVIGLAFGAALWAAADPVSAILGFSETLGPVQGLQLVRACALWFALSLAFLVPGIVARSSQALVLISIVQTLATLGLWLGAWMLLQRAMPLIAVVQLGMGLTLAAALATLFALRHQIEWGGPIRFATRQLSEDARFSAGMFAAQAAGTLVNQGDRMLVAALGSPAMAGLYALCVNVANKSVAAVVAINSFVFPHVAGLRSAGQQDATIGLVHALDRSVAALFVPVLVPGLLLAGTFLRLWLGDFATSDLIVAFRLLLIAFAILAFAVPISNVFVASGQSGLSARYSWLTVAVVFGSMFYSVPRFGLIGAACAMLLGYSTSLLFAASARRALGIPPAAQRGRFWAGLVAGCAAQGALIAVLGPWISGWLGLLALGSTAWLSFYLVRALVRTLTPEEQQILQRASNAASAWSRRRSGREGGR